MQKTQINVVFSTCLKIMRIVSVQTQVHINVLSFFYNLTARDVSGWSVHNIIPLKIWGFVSVCMYINAANMPFHSFTYIPFFMYWYEFIFHELPFDVWRSNHLFSSYYFEHGFFSRNDQIPNPSSYKPNKN